jgi:hypothetical protein
VAAAWNLGPASWFAERVLSGGPDGARRLRGHHAGSGDQGGQAADDPGGRCRAAVLVPELPFAGLGQHRWWCSLASWPMRSGWVNMAFSCLSGAAGAPGLTAQAGPPGPALSRGRLTPAARQGE